MCSSDCFMNNETYYIMKPRKKNHSKNVILTTECKKGIFLVKSIFQNWSNDCFLSLAYFGIYLKGYIPLLQNYVLP